MFKPLSTIPLKKSLLPSIVIIMSMMACILVTVPLEVLKHYPFRMNCPVLPESASHRLSGAAAVDGLYVKDAAMAHRTVGI